MTHNLVNTIISPYKKVMGRNYIPYKNHVHRIVNFTLELKKEKEKDDEEKIAIAAVYHDIGIWTANTFDYLEPSTEEARKYLQGIDKLEWMEEIFLIINMHHKYTEYKGKYIDNIESFRKADLIDLLKGLKSFGLSKAIISKNYRKFPMKGFRKIVLFLFIKQLFTNPLNPLPMFKK